MIKVDSISKTFKLYRSPADRLKEIVTRNKYHKDFQALNNVSFAVADGETLGIIGQNGAGKSTLLKILTGILLPDNGTISIDGKITGLLELGTGFNAEMTGIENIYMNGTLLGMSRDEIDREKGEIVDFTELGEFIYEQLKTYSSGMVMRLAFSIAIHADPKCFVVDEALSVGDAYFQQKCMSKIREFREKGGSIIFVSHDMNAIKMICDYAIFLHHGEIIEHGIPEDVVNSYNFMVAKNSDAGHKITIETRPGATLSYGTFDARITRVAIIGTDSRSDVLNSGEIATIIVEIEALNDLNDLSAGILIRDKYGQDIFGTNTYHHQKRFDIRKGIKYRVVYRVQMNIGPGQYTITAAVHGNYTSEHRRLHWIDRVINFEVAGNRGYFYIGVCKLYPELDINQM